MSETIVIKKNGVEIGRVTAEKLEYARKLASMAIIQRQAEMEDYPKLFTAKDASGKALFVARVSEDKEITTEREE